MWLVRAQSPCMIGVRKMQYKIEITRLPSGKYFISDSHKKANEILIDIKEGTSLVEIQIWLASFIENNSLKWTKSPMFMHAIEEFSKIKPGCIPETGEVNVVDLTGSDIALKYGPV